MKVKLYLSLGMVCLFSFCTTFNLQAQKQMEKLNRGLIAVRLNPLQVYIGWRLFGTDPSSLAFNVYRGQTKINDTPIAGATNYTDTSLINETYTVRPVLNGKELPSSEPATVWQQSYLSISLLVPPPGVTPTGESYTYSPNDCSVADLDGDGEYEIVVKWDPSNAKDNSQSGYTGNVYLDAYKLNGTRLWRIDLGKNIRAGAHYTQLMVYDLDGDGKGEVAVKTADGTIDGTGKVIGDATKDWRNSAGYILTGPEFLTVFNGETGAAMATTNYLPARGTVSSWGDNYGNRVDRFISAIAYVDGRRPSLIMGRGYYTRMVRVAWDWRDGKLTHRWTFDSNTPGNGSYYGQGNHQLTVGDVDGDGKQEICNGSSTIDDNGKGLYFTGLGHGDALHMSDMDPDRPGQEVWQCYESPASYGTMGLRLRDGKTGEHIFGVATTGDIGRAMAADIDPRYKGYEMWGPRGVLYSCKGQEISTTKPGSQNFGLWWDGDLQRELLSGTTLEKWNYTAGATAIMTAFDQYGAASINGTKATPNISADIMGDWREEVVYRSSDNTKLLLFTTTIPTQHRLYTLMHDPQYRVQVALQNSAYNQPPHPGFYLGEEMILPEPNIVLEKDTTPPVAFAQNKTLFLDENGKASITAQQIDNGSYDNNGIAKIELNQTNFDCSKTGENKVALRVTDFYNNTAADTAIVTIVDTIAPVVKTKSGTFKLVNGKADIDASLLNDGSSDICGISSFSVSKSSFSCMEIGQHEVIVTVTDKNGNKASAPALVTIKGAIPSPSITVSRLDNTPTGGNSQTIYLGYGAQELQLAAANATSTENETAFAWSPTTFLSNATQASTSFRPTTAGMFEITVTAFNEFGCTAPAVTTLTVIDARCGDTKNKVIVCHNGAEICIATTDVQNHLSHGCTVGHCSGSVSATQLRGNSAEPQEQSTFLAAYPNPASSAVTLKAFIAEKGAYRIELFTLQGSLIKLLGNGTSAGNQSFNVPVTTDALANGTYLIKLSTSNGTKTHRLVVHK